MPRRLVLYAALIAASAVTAAIWATACECGKPIPASPVAAAAPVPAAALRADPTWPAALRAKDAPPTRAYIVECKLVHTSPGGEPEILASPKLMTLEGEPAAIRVGRELPPPKDSGVAKGPFEGLSCALTVYHADSGQTFLDAELTKSWTPANAKSNSLRLANIGLRMIEAIELGEKITVPLGEDGEKTAATHFEVVVTKATDKATTTTAGKPSVERSR